MIILTSLLIGCKNEGDGSKKTGKAMDEFGKKIWVDEKWNRSEAYENISLLFSRVDDGKIKGYFLPNRIITSDLELYSTGKKNYGEIIGDYKDNRANCKMKWEEENIEGDLQILFLDSNRIKVQIQYNLKASDCCVNSTILLKPYNLKDIESDTRSSYECNVSEINLEKWGAVKFVSIIRTSTKRKTLFLYLTDNAGNIIYDFSQETNFPNDFKIKEFLFTDINKDGRKDLLLILTGISDSKICEVNIYEQNELGGFKMNKEMAKKLNKRKKLHDYSMTDVLKYIER